ncbi:MAG: transglycosylase domain-containing protein, partial [Hyphomicrobiaceae bacterium]
MRPTMWPFGRKKTRNAVRAPDPFGYSPGAREPVGKRKTRTRKAPRLSWRWKFRLFVVAPLSVALLGTAAAGLLFAHYSSTFPNPLSLRHKERAPIIRILAVDGSVMAERGAAHDYMPLDLLPRHVTDAVVATEDRRFYEHGGLDPFGLVR